MFCYSKSWVRQYIKVITKWHSIYSQNCTLRTTPRRYSTSLIHRLIWRPKLRVSAPPLSTTFNKHQSLSTTICSLMKKRCKPVIVNILHDYYIRRYEFNITPATEHIIGSKLNLLHEETSVAKTIKTFKMLKKCEKNLYEFYVTLPFGFMLVFNTWKGEVGALNHTWNIFINCMCYMRKGKWSLNHVRILKKWGLWSFS